VQAVLLQGVIINDPLTQITACVRNHQTGGKQWKRH
jgi:hypothetical protein